MNMSKLNPNAGEFVPSFPLSVPAESCSRTSVSPRKQYPIEFLLQFRTVCDRVTSVPDLLRAEQSAELRIGRVSSGRVIYSIEELLQFQYLYFTRPVEVVCPDILATYIPGKKGNRTAKSKKDKDKKQLLQSQNHLQYGPSLICYFNPNEYAAGVNVNYFGGEDGGEVTESGLKTALNTSSVTTTKVDAYEESKTAVLEVNRLLDDLENAEITDLVAEFSSISISSIATLKSVVGTIFDRAISDPSRCDSYAQLCSAISEKTPEFKDGAKTVNFRRIFVTRCYEGLLEESSDSNEIWRRKSLLTNVEFVGEMFRRQLLTENIIHVCIAIMLENETNPKDEILKAVCRLISFIGDLLDGSSPASRRTMDEYFEVLQRISNVSEDLRTMIANLSEARSSGWGRKRSEVPLRVITNQKDLMK